MDQTDALAALAALSHETRLQTFRMLVEAGPEGLPAGVIAERLGVLANTMSSHLAQLARARLATTRREGRIVRYAADHAGMRNLIAFLLQDCCGGRPEICLSLAAIAAECASSAPSCPTPETAN